MIAETSNDETKYPCLVSRQVLSVVCGIIRNPPHIRHYDTLKSKIIEFFLQSESAQLKLLLQDLQLGELAMVADKICEISYFQAVSEVRQEQVSVLIQALRDEISVLSDSQDRLSKQQARSSFRWRRNRSSQSSGQIPENLSTVFRYHYRFRKKAKARKCVNPCQHSEN
ncbi:hypothetical protein AVEN_22478-1 [Araneus ventricosus]|uniref:Uncharacterized protein n=1 Tax=Araneus ventricosus TaxID=182803 RepID=A0A4Y2NZ72_ARAVE|nr:hypothetical protein AVEN_22478-1 [Araneus ventricosus]